MSNLIISHGSFDRFKFESFSLGQTRKLINSKFLGILRYFQEIKKRISLSEYKVLEKMIEKSNPVLLATMELYYKHLCTEEEFVSNLLICHEKVNSSFFKKNNVHCTSVSTNSKLKIQRVSKS